MDSVRENVLETAGLGRPFQLGMLYDCRSDAIVPGVTLWNRKELQQNKDVSSQGNTEFAVTASDTIKEKSKHLKVDGELKLSLLGGIVQLSGAARYFNDTKKSFNQERLTLHYRSTTRFEQLTMNHLAKGNIGHPEVFDHDVATHVVTAVLYGADAYFVFDREVNLSEETKDVQGEMKIALDKLKILCSAGAHLDINMNEKEAAAVKQLSCTFYGDFMLPSNPTTFEDAMKVYADLPTLLGQDGEHAVPIKVWLYPLVKLDSRAAKLQRNITSELIRAVESVIDTLNVTNMKCDDLLQDTVAKTFSTFHDQVQDFQKFTFEYKQDFMKKLGCLLPEIRGGQSDISAINELIGAHEKSPFNTNDVEKWITKKEKESNQVKALLKQLHELGAEVPDNIDKYLLDLDFENLVSFAFTCLEYPDALLVNQQNYLKNPSENTVASVFQNKSLTSNDLMCMRNNLKLFKGLITSNKSQNTKFIVQSLSQTSRDECSCILMYEYSEAVRFVPPSKPKHPNIESVTDDSITVKLDPPCSATLERKLLYRMKQEDSWKEQPINQDIETLSGLTKGTDYEIKCGAVGKLNFMVESGAITAKTTSLKDLRSTQSESTQQMVENRFFVLVAGNTLNSHEDFIEQLKIHISLQQVPTVGQCDFILAFCPVVSRAGTDIEAALKKLNQQSDTKPAVLLVLHHTFDPEHVVPDSSRFVKRKNTITVDCLFHEDKGLLQCPKNNQSLFTALSYINPHGEDQGQETARRDLAMMIKNTQQGHHDQTKNIVDPGTVERMTNKAEESDNAQHKKDQQPEDEHQRLDHFIVEKMKKSHEEIKKKMDMEMENVKKYVETSTNIISDKEKLLTEKKRQLKKMKEDLDEHTNTIQMKTAELKMSETKLEQTQIELDETKKELEKRKKLNEVKNTELQNMNKRLTERETELKKMKEDLEEKTNTIQMKTAELKKNETKLEQTQIELDETKKELEKSKKLNEVKNTQLQNMEKLLTERETELKKMNEDLETSKNQLKTPGQELQDNTEFAEKNKQPKEKEKCLTERKTQEKEKDEEDAGTDLKRKLQNSKEQKVEKIEEPVKKTNAVGENNGNPTQETHAQDKETNKNVDEGYKKFSEENEHQEDQDTQEKKKDAVRNESSGANERCNNSGENKQQVKKQDPDVSESQRQQEEKHRPQLENTQNMSKVQDESGKATMEVQEEDKKENQCEQESDSRKATIASQEQDKGEKWSKPSGHDPDSSSSEID